MGFGCRVYIFSCDINRLIFSKCDKWPLQWSASSFEASEEEKKKKIANLVLQFRKTLDEDFFFPTPAFPVDKLSSPAHGLFKLLPI